MSESHIYLDYLSEIIKCFFYTHITSRTAPNLPKVTKKIAHVFNNLHLVVSSTLNNVCHLNVEEAEALIQSSFRYMPQPSASEDPEEGVLLFLWCCLGHKL